MSHPCPTVAVVIPLMDRASDLELSLAALAEQDYRAMTIHLVDMSSHDGDRLRRIKESVSPNRVRILRCPRPAYFSFARSRNIGVRHSSSDLLLFLNADNVPQSVSVVSEMVLALLRDTPTQGEWWSAWRKRAGCPSVRVRTVTSATTRFPRAFGHCLGSPLLVARDIFEQLGGYNEALTDWGYEDTDLVARLECIGLKRFEITGLTQAEHGDDVRVANFRDKKIHRSWERNLRKSDQYLRCFGPIVRTSVNPGSTPWIEVEGERLDYRTRDVGGDWTMTNVFGAYARRSVVSVLSRCSQVVWSVRRLVRTATKRTSRSLFHD